MRLIRGENVAGVVFDASALVAVKGGHPLASTAKHTICLQLSIIQTLIQWVSVEGGILNAVACAGDDGLLLMNRTFSYASS